MRSIFDINNLNLTEFARSFGLYKNLVQKVTIATKHFQTTPAKESRKRSQKELKQQSEVVTAGAEEAKLYSKRLLKAK